MTAKNDFIQVTVTGAGGRTGSLIFQKLLEAPGQFEARAVVRTDKACTAHPAALLPI